MPGQAGILRRQGHQGRGTRQRVRIAKALITALVYKIFRRLDGPIARLVGVQLALGNLLLHRLNALLGDLRHHVICRSRQLVLEGKRNHALGATYGLSVGANRGRCRCLAGLRWWWFHRLNKGPLRNRLVQWLLGGCPVEGLGFLVVAAVVCGKECTRTNNYAIRLGNPSHTLTHLRLCLLENIHRRCDAPIVGLTVVHLEKVFMLKGGTAGATIATQSTSPTVRADRLGWR